MSLASRSHQAAHTQAHSRPACVPVPVHVTILHPPTTRAHATTTTAIHQQHARTHKIQLRRTAAKTLATARPSVFLFGFGGDDYSDDDSEDCTVIKLQVGIFGDITRWQRKFNRMSELYDTEETEGLHGILQETLQLLLRNNEYCQYALSAGRLFNDFDDAEAKFNEVSFSERAKCEEETLSNVDGRKVSESDTSSDESKDKDQWMCITMVMAVAREIKLPPISTVFDLQKVLKVLGGIGVDDLMAFELIWTPQQEGDSYSKDELLMDFPTLITLI